MEIEPPPSPANPEAGTGKLPPRGRGLLSVMLLWIGVVLAVTLIAWAVLWSGGGAAAARSRTPDSTRNEQLQPKTP